jgi:hypothetical protein
MTEPYIVIHYDGKEKRIDLPLYGECKITTRDGEIMFVDVTDKIKLK